MLKKLNADDFTFENLNALKKENAEGTIFSQVPGEISVLFWTNKKVTEEDLMIYLVAASITYAFENGVCDARLKKRLLELFNGRSAAEVN